MLLILLQLVVVDIDYSYARIVLFWSKLMYVRNHFVNDYFACTV